MKKNQFYTLITSMLLLTAPAFAQVKMGDNPTTINTSSLLELESSNKGLLMPRVTLSNTLTWGLAGTAVAGMTVYNTNDSIVSGGASYPAYGAGVYTHDGTGWLKAKSGILSTAQNGTSIQYSPGIGNPFSVLPGSSATIFIPADGRFVVTAIGYLHAGDLNPNTSIFASARGLLSVFIDGAEYSRAEAIGLTLPDGSTGAKFYGNAAVINFITPLTKGTHTIDLRVTVSSVTNTFNYNWNDGAPFGGRTSGWTLSPIY